MCPFIILTTRFVLVLIFAFLPPLGGQISNTIGKILAFVSCAGTLLSWFYKFQRVTNFSLLWIATAIYLVINARREAARLAPRQQDVEIHHTQTFSLQDTKASRTPDTTEVDSSSKGSRVDLGQPSLQSKRTSVI